MLKTARELIEALKTRPQVLGILQYGSGMCPEAADTDLCVVVAERPRGLESIHFWLADGPVDLNVRTIAELQTARVAPEFDEVLREGTVLFEREPGALVCLSSLRASQTRLPTPAQFAGMRHGHAHYLSKLDYYKHRDPLLCKVLLCGAAHWLLHAYVEVRGMPYRGETAALSAMAQKDSGLLADFELLSGGNALEDRIDALRRLTARVLEPVGGAWQREEVLYFAASGEDASNRDEWVEFFESLIGAEQNEPDNK